MKGRSWPITRPSPLSINLAKRIRGKLSFKYGEMKIPLLLKYGTKPMCRARYFDG